MASNLSLFAKIGFGSAVLTNVFLAVTGTYVLDRQLVQPQIKLRALTTTVSCILFTAFQGQSFNVSLCTGRQVADFWW